MQNLLAMLSISLMLIVTSFSALAQEDELTVTITNAFEAPMTEGNEMSVDEGTLTVGGDDFYDGIIFNIAVTDTSINMEFEVSDRAMRDPSGIVQPNVFERYYLTFSEPVLAGAVANPDATLTPYVQVLSPTEVLVEISEGMELGEGFDAEIRLAPADVTVTTLESGATLTSYVMDDLTVHAYTSPFAVFANGSYIFELPNSLVIVDTQFLLPFAQEFRSIADSTGKPIDRVVITHEHPDHFLGSEAFADVDVYALAEVAAAIEANGQAEIDEKTAQFGDEMVASTFVVPQVIEAGSVEIDGVTFEFEAMVEAEAEIQLVTKLPDYGVVAVGDIVYSRSHLILAGNPPTWIAALSELQAESYDYPVVLAGHGLPGDPSVYSQNISWLMTAGELMGTVETGEDFKAGLIEAYPDFQLEAAIDFVLPFLFPTDE